MTAAKLKREKRNWRLALTYIFMTSLVVAGVVVTFGWAMGFRLDWRGKVSQVALVQLNSFPTGANITLGTTSLSGSTPEHVNTTTGKKLVKISLLGYKDWSTTADIRAGQVLWLNYARLVPTKISTTTVKNFTKTNSDALAKDPATAMDLSGASMLASPDKTKILLQLTPMDRTFLLAKVSDPKSPTFSTFALDGDKISTPADDQHENFSLIEWTQNSRYVLLSHQIMNGPDVASQEFLSIDTQTIDKNNVAETRNLTRDFGAILREPHFAGGDGQTLFAIASLNGEDDVRRLDYGSNTLSAPLVTNVKSYQIYGDQIFAFVAENNGVQTVGMWHNGDAKTIAKYADGRQTFALYTKDNGRDYVAIYRAVDTNVAQSKNSVKIIEQPLGDATPKTSSFDIPFAISSAKDFAISPSGRFIMSQNDRNIASYDVETKRNYSFEMTSSGRGFDWIDDYHLLDASGAESLGWVEFNGENRAKIVDGFGAPSLSADGKYFYSLRTTADGGVNLQKSQMVVN